MSFLINKLMLASDSAPVLGYEPTGICACGCGRSTIVPVRNVRTKNRFKGVPAQFMKGHYRRAMPTTGYKARLVSGVLRKIHRLRAETALGKPLPKGAVVHHADGSKDAFSPLVVCQDTAYHALLHARMRIVAAGGNPNTDRICYKCRAVKPLEMFYANRGDFMGRSRVCKVCDNTRRVKAS